MEIMLKQQFQLAKIFKEQKRIKKLEKNRAEKKRANELKDLQKK